MCIWYMKCMCLSGIEANQKPRETRKHTHTNREREKGLSRNSMYITRVSEWVCLYEFVCTHPHFGSLCWKFSSYSLALLHFKRTLASYTLYYVRVCDIPLNVLLIIKTPTVREFRREASWTWEWFPHNFVFPLAMHKNSRLAVHLWGTHFQVQPFRLMLRSEFLLTSKYMDFIWNLFARIFYLREWVKDISRLPLRLINCSVKYSYRHSIW